MEESSSIGIPCAGGPGYSSPLKKMAQEPRGVGSYPRDFVILIIIGQIGLMEIVKALSSYARLTVSFYRHSVDSHSPYCVAVYHLGRES